MNDKIKGVFRAGEFVVIPESSIAAYQMGFDHGSSGQDDLCCPKCGALYPTARDLVEHVEQIHGLTPPVGPRDEIRHAALKWAIEVWRKNSADTWNASSITSMAAEFERYLRNGNAMTSTHVKGLVGEAEDRAGQFEHVERVMAGEHRRQISEDGKFEAIGQPDPDPMFWHKPGGEGDAWTLRHLTYPQIEAEASEMIGAAWPTWLAILLKLPTDELRIWKMQPDIGRWQLVTALLAAYRTICPRQRKA